jgi:uncharacterized membrane-anchored protein
MAMARNEILHDKTAACTCYRELDRRASAQRQGWEIVTFVDGEHTPHRLRCDYLALASQFEGPSMNQAARPIAMNAAKVPAVTLGFWIIKILATTLGETGGDTITMTWLGETTSEATGYGYLIGTGIIAIPFVVLVTAQVMARKFHPFLYWATIAASTMLGTTLADFATRSLGIGYPGGSILLFSLVVLSLAGWYWSEGSVSVQTVNTPRVELWYWITITFSQTLGTALGDWAADSGLGYDGGALAFGAVLAAVAAAYYWTRVSHVLLFWAAFILTRPLGATVGDFLDKPMAKGGLAVSRPLATAALAVVIVALIFLLPQRAGRHPSTAAS